MSDRIDSRKLDLSGIASAAEAMSAAFHSLRAPRGLPQLIYPTVPCRFCGEVYRSVKLFDLDRLCPDCTIALERIAEKIGRTMSATDLARLADRSSRWTGQAIRYGRPWQDHVPAHNRHLLNEQP